LDDAGEARRLTVSSVDAVAGEGGEEHLYKVTNEDQAVGKKELGVGRSLARGKAAITRGGGRTSRPLENDIFET